MFGDNSSSIFWNIIKNKKENNDVSAKEKQYSFFLERKSNELGVEGDLMAKIEKLSTYKKICLLQGLLKEMKSIKERFEDNKKEMLEKIRNNCYNFYQCKIGMKEIYDYSTTDTPEIHNNYTLIEDPKEKLEHNFDMLYKILFLIRDNNDIMINIIKNCPTKSFEQLSDFIVNFFYENTIESTFNEEELLVIIYLIIEDLIINKMPKTFSALNLNKHSYIDDSILSHIFRSITRKVDVRNFICTILTEILIKLEGYNKSLSISTKQNKPVDNNCFETKIFTRKSVETENNKINITRAGFNEENISKRRNLTMVGGFSSNLGKKLHSTLTIRDNPKKMGSSLLSIEEGEGEGDGEELGKRLMSEDLEKKLEIEKIKLNPFFENTSVTLGFLNQVLAQYDEAESQDCTTIAMRDFIDMQINQISCENCEEIFSNNIKNDKLKNFIFENTTEKSDELVNSIINNYKRITNFINKLLEIIYNNITSLPYILKSIYMIIDVLIDKKYSNKKVKSLEYQKLMLLSNYLIGNVILPLVTNPNYSGIVTTDVISKITKDNLEIVTKIFKKMLSGKLFDNKSDPEYTIFNKYIILALPKVFCIINSITSQKKKLNLCKKIQYLMDSINDIDNPNRNINYEYFNENQENIQQQSVCFSWQNLIILIDLIKCNKELLNNVKYKKIIEEFQKFREYCANKYRENKDKRKYEFFLLEKINYNPDFQNNINRILEDNIFALMPNNENDNISIFKKCLVDVLAYVNILHKENFNYYVQKNRENRIQDYDIILKLLIEQTYKDYIANEFEGGGEGETPNPTHHNNDEKMFEVNFPGLEENDNEDADFRDILFPQIIESVKYELSHNLDDVKAKRIVFCSSYLQLHINDLPENYKGNNYCLLLMEIMKKGEEIINELNVSILNQFYLKFKGGEKLNMIISNNYNQIKNMEKCICIEYLFEKLELPCKFNVKTDKEKVITYITYEQINREFAYIRDIQTFIDLFPDFRKFEDKVDDLIDHEEKVELCNVLNSYFKDLRTLIKNENIVKRFSADELETIIFELENYILFKLHDKLFPGKSTKTDIKFYNKCCRLKFVKPENLIKDKKMINEKLWEAAMVLINEMDTKLTPQDKVKNFGKAFAILQNSITFCSGKNELGIDDTISTLIYVVLKSSPKNISSNSKYCQLFLNPELAKKQYGILMSQLEMVKNIIYDMKYTDLIGVTEEEFGKDEDV